MRLLHRVWRRLPTPLRDRLRPAVGRLDPRSRQRRGWDRRAQRDARALRALIGERLEPGGVAVDVGAHSGEILALLVERAPTAGHHAVEPLPELAAHLRRRFPTVTVHECAVADHSGSATFHRIVDRPAWSGLQVQEQVAEDRSEPIEVPIATLDDLLDGVDVRLVKIDVEGAELAVIRGGAAVLSRCRPTVVFEHAITHASAYGTQPGEVFDALDALGYRLSPLGDDRPLDRHAFVALCEEAHASGYGADSFTNFVALPAEGG